MRKPPEGGLLGGVVAFWGGGYIVRYVIERSYLTLLVGQIRDKSCPTGLPHRKVGRTVERECGVAALFRLTGLDSATVRPNLSPLALRWANYVSPPFLVASLRSPLESTRMSET